MRALTVGELIELLDRVPKELMMHTDHPLISIRPNGKLCRARGDKDRLHIQFDPVGISAFAMLGILSYSIGTMVKGYKVSCKSNSFHDYMEGAEMKVTSNLPVGLGLPWMYDDVRVTGVSYNNQFCFLKLVKFVPIEDYELMQWHLFNTHTITQDLLDRTLDKLEAWRNQNVIGFNDLYPHTEEEPFGKLIYGS